MAPVPADQSGGKRKEASFLLRRRRLALLLVLFSVPLLAGAFFWVRSSQAFALQRVCVTATEHVGSEEVVKSLGDVQGVGLLQVSTEELEHNLMSIPYVKQARVFRHFPHAIDVELVEREPLALVETANGSRWIVDEDGRLLEEAGDEGASEWLLVTPEIDEWAAGAGDLLSPQVVRALEVVSRIGARGSSWSDAVSVESIRVKQTGEVVILVAGDAEVRLGDPVQLEEKLRVTEEIIKRYLREGQALDYLDVHMPGKAVVKGKGP